MKTLFVFLLHSSLWAATLEVAAIPVDFQEADKKLNDTYKSIMSGIAAEAQAHLKKAQIAWLPYRDMSSELEQQLGAGEGDGTDAYYACMTYLTRKQVEWLELIWTGLWDKTSKVLSGQTESVQQFASRLKDSDRILNSVYKTEMRQFAPDVQEKIKNLQLVWIRYRDLMAIFQEIQCPDPNQKQVYADAIKDVLTEEQTNRLRTIKVPRDYHSILEYVGGRSDYSKGTVTDTFSALIMRGKPAIPVLISILHSDNIRLHEHAVNALGAMGTDAIGSLPMLRDALGGQFSESARNVAPMALARMGSAGLAIMLDVLSTCNDETADILMQGFQIVDTASVPEIIKAFEMADEECRPRFAQALGTVCPDTRTAITMLTASLEKENTPLHSATKYALDDVNGSKLNTLRKDDPLTLTYTTDKNGSITGATVQKVNYGESGTSVTAVPDTGYHFTEWSDGVPSDIRQDLDNTQDLTMSAGFALDYHPFTIKNTEGGYVSVNIFCPWEIEACPGSSTVLWRPEEKNWILPFGTTILLTRGNVFGKVPSTWVGIGSFPCSGDENETCTFQLTEPTTVESYYTRQQFFSMSAFGTGTLTATIVSDTTQTWSVGHGQPHIHKNAHVNDGSVVTITAVPAEGCRFIGWEQETLDDNQLSYSFVINENKFFVAHFGCTNITEPLSSNNK